MSWTNLPRPFVYFSIMSISARFWWKVSLHKCRKLDKVAERVGAKVMNEVKVTIFGNAAIFNQFNDFGVLQTPPFSPHYVLHRS